MTNPTNSYLTTQHFDLQTLRLFTLVCDSGSIGQAAQLSQLAASAVSKRLSDLERQLNIALLVRHNRGVKPTVAGECLLRHSKAILANLSSVQHELIELAAGIRGQVRLHANNSAIFQFLADDLVPFIQQNNLIKLVLNEQISPQVVQDVIDGIADIGICNYSSISPQQLNKLQTKPYQSDQLVLVMHWQHPLNQHSKIDFNQALDYEFIGFNTSSSIDFLVKQAANAHGKAFKTLVQVSSIDLLLRLVSQQLGLAIVPSHAANLAQQNGLLRVIELNEAWVQREFHLIARNFAHLTDAGTKLVEHLLVNNNNYSKHKGENSHDSKNSLRQNI